MRRYKCHKEVTAAQIASIHQLEIRDPDGGKLFLLNLKDEGFPAQGLVVSAEFLNKHNPVKGDYLVLYDDGYLSISPPGAFEKGYSTLN